MNTWHVSADGNTGNFGVVPVDRERDGRVAEDGEVEGVVGVLPDIVAAEYEMFGKGLLQTRVELVAETGLQGGRDAGLAEQQRSQNGAAAALAGENQVLVERRLQRASVRGAQDGAGLPDG